MPYIADKAISESRTKIAKSDIGITARSSHSRYMADHTTNQIKRLRAEKKLSQVQLAEAVGAHWITISKLERGKIRLTQDWMNRIASALQVDPTDLIKADHALKDIALEGLMADGFSSVVIKGLDNEWSRPQRLKLDFGSSKGERDIWVMVGTDSFYPLLHSGDFVKFVYLPDWGYIDALVNRLCLIHPFGGGEPVVGFLKWVGKEKIFDLEVPGSKPVRNIQAEDIAGATVFVNQLSMVG